MTDITVAKTNLENDINAKIDIINSQIEDILT